MKTVTCFVSSHTAGLMRRAADEWPAPDWPHWLRYDGKDDRGKLVCADALAMPEPCRLLLGWMATVPEAEPEVDYAIPDLSFYAAGMNAMPAGTALGVHLDADRHPRFGLRRVANSVLFLGEWQKGWGGELEFWAPDGKRPRKRIPPAHGRLLTFPATDDGYHGVARVRCPPGVLRKTLMLCWYGEPVVEARRPRALFMNAAGQDRTGTITDEQRRRAGLPPGG